MLWPRNPRARPSTDQLPGIDRQATRAHGHLRAAPQERARAIRHPTHFACFAYFVVERIRRPTNALFGRLTPPHTLALARLTNAARCLTLYNMKTATLTIRLDEDLNDLLTDASRSSGRNRSEVAREALRRQLRLSRFETLRRRIMPLAEARGFLTDEDVFSQVS